MEQVFCVIFALELVVKCRIHGWAVCKTSWLRFEAFLVCINMLSLLVTHPVVTAARALRLVRLIHPLRLIEQFREIWKLARGMVGCIRTVLAACVLLLMALYICACWGMELVNHSKSLLDDSDSVDVMQDHFSSMGVTMLTLIQFATGDGISDVYLPLVTKSWHLAFYFIAVWVTLAVVLMNLTTAVIVEHAIAEGSKDREMRRRMNQNKFNTFKPFVSAIFRELNTRSCELLSREEIKAGMGRVVMAMREKRFGRGMPEELKDIVESGALVDLFDYIDVDASGFVDPEEFLAGVAFLTLKPVPAATITTLHLLRSQVTRLRNIEDFLYEKVGREGRDGR